MTSRVDMHCHSTASQLSRLGVQRSLGLPECATPPEEVYELAKRRGMDFVTITDHDTIAGCLELEGRPDCFVSEELTARFAGEPQAVHVLCYGITPGDHEWLQANSGDLEACAAYLARERDRLRARAPLLQRGGAADAASPPPPCRAVPGLGGAQRVAGRGAEHARRHLHRDARRRRHRRLRRPRRRGHRPHLHRGAGRCDAGRVSAAAAPRRRRSRWRAGERGQVGARGDGPGDPRPGLRRGERRGRRSVRTEPGGGAEDGGTGDPRGGRARGQGRRRHRTGRCPCLLEAWLAAIGLDLRGPRADRLPAVRRLLPRRPLPAGTPYPRPTPARRRPRRDRGGRSRRSRRRASTGSSRRSSRPFPTRPRPCSSGPRRRSSAAARASAAGSP